MTTYDLIEEPWLPCRRADGRASSLGLRAALVLAPELRELHDSSPLVEVALHRLLLAIVHRIFGPADSATWARLWTANQWDEPALTAYLDHWRGRFDLFDPDRPFYQAADLDFGYANSVAMLAHELAPAANQAVLFDHTLADAPVWMTPDRAARAVVAHQAFSLGGFLPFERGQDPKLFKSADAGPLTKGAVCLIRGDTLFQTLMLNLHRYHPADEEPFPVRGDDLPAWERDVGPRAGDRMPTGYLDLLTWQSRRIRLAPEVGPDGTVQVRRCVIMKGAQFPDGYSRHGREPMLAFVHRQKAPAGQDPWPAVSFQPDRVVWRDSLALVQSLAEHRTRPQTVTWLHDLVAEGRLDRSRLLAIDLLGMSVDRAKVFLWRHERLPLPLLYLDEPNLVHALEEALTAANSVHKDLCDAVDELAKLLLAPASDDRQNRQPLPADCTALRKHLGPARRYWARLEQPFLALLHQLPEDRSEADGESVYGRRELDGWSLTLRRAAEAALAEATRGQDRSARGLKAAARAESFLRHRLHQTLGHGGAATDLTVPFSFAVDPPADADELAPA